MRRTLIVGCGYLGRRVGTLLTGRGDVVFGTTRSASKAETLRDVGIHPVILDVADPSTLSGTLPLDSAVYALGFDRSGGQSRRSSSTG